MKKHNKIFINSLLLIIVITVAGCTSTSSSPATTNSHTSENQYINLDNVGNFSLQLSDFPTQDYWKKSGEAKLVKSELPIEYIKYNGVNSSYEAMFISNSSIECTPFKRSCLLYENDKILSHLILIFDTASNAQNFNCYVKGEDKEIYIGLKNVKAFFIPDGTDVTRQKLLLCFTEFNIVNEINYLGYFVNGLSIKDSEFIKSLAEKVLARQK